MRDKGGIVKTIYNYYKMGKLNKGLFSSNTDMWATPKKFFEDLDAEFHFTLDPCATPENAKCSLYFTESANGLLQNWGAHRILQPALWQGNFRLGA